jgi:transcriptional regulator with GAF, ATPase, and Fis domain
MSVFPLHIPPLRDRPEDIKLLAEHFAARSGRRHSGRPLEPSEEDIALLTSYGWPGNVRELSAVIERATILGAGRRLATAAALQSFVAVPPSLPDVPERIPSQASHSLDVQPLDVIVARHIEHALRVSNGQIEGARGAAALLGINPHTLRARMRKLGIDWTVFRLRTSGSGTPTRTF